MKAIKSEIVGGFEVKLVDLGFGYQVRTYFTDGVLYETQLNKPTRELGMYSFDMAVATLKKTLRIC